MKRKYVIFGIGLLALCILEIKRHMLQKTEPLKPEEVLYNYVIALHELSGIGIPDHTHFDLLQKINFCKRMRFSNCPTCHRPYVGKISTCPKDQEKLNDYALDDFKAYVDICEQFHQDLLKASRIHTFGYAAIMKLFYLKKHAGVS